MGRMVSEDLFEVIIEVGFGGWELVIWRKVGGRIFLGIRSSLGKVFKVWNILVCLRYVKKDSGENYCE